MQYQGHRLLVVFVLTLLVLVAGGRPTFAEGPDERDAAITLSCEECRSWEISQGRPDFQTQDAKAKDLGGQEAKKSISTQDYDWSDD